MLKTFSEYLEFIKESKIIEGAIMFFLGGMIKSLMHRIMREIIIPVTQGKFKKLYFDYNRYAAEIIQIVVTSYLLFLLHKGVRDIL